MQVKTGRITVGFLTPAATNNNISVLISGMRDAAVKSGANLVVASYDGERPGPVGRLQYSMALDFLSGFSLDGLMFLGWMPQFSGPNLDYFLGRFRNLPLLSVGSGKPGLASVWVDSNSSFIDMLEHLIIDHGFRRITMVPALYPDDRSHIFKEIAGVHGLGGLCQELSAEALASAQSNMRAEAIAALIPTEAGLRPQAIIFPYLYEMISVEGFLSKRGVEIPKDMAAVCCEDGEAGQYQPSEYSSIVYPWRELGFRSFSGMVARVKGIVGVGAAGAKNHSRNLEPVRSFFASRASCGCPMKPGEAGAPSQRLGAAERERVLRGAPFYQDSPQPLPTRVGKEITAALARLPAAGSLQFPDSLVSAVCALLRELRYSEEFAELEERLSELERSYSSQSSHLWPAFSRGRSLLHEARLKQAGLRNEAYINDETYFRDLRNQISLSATREEVLDGLCAALSQGAVENLFLMLKPEAEPLFYAILEERDRDRASETIGLVLAVANRTRLSPPKRQDAETSVAGLFQSEGRHDLIALMLNAANESLGVILTEPGPADLRNHQNLASIIGGQIQATGLIHQGSLRQERLEMEISLRREREQELLRIARFDALTGLLNRHSFYRCIHALSPGDEGTAILFFDLDKFKPINDLYGHETGDIFLAETARRLRESLGRFARPAADLDPFQQTPAIFRLGGDEFIVMAKTANLAERQDLSRRIIECVEEPLVIKGSELSVSCSVGLSVWPDDSQDTSALIRFADMAMYRAKRSGGGFALFDPSQDLDYLEQLGIEKDLPDALSNGEIMPHFQIIFRAGDGDAAATADGTGARRGRLYPAGVEALARWDHPRLGRLLPERFMQAAVRAELDQRIGDHILDQACATFKAIPEGSRRGLFVLVNLSSRQFFAPSFLDSVKACLGRYGLSPSDLKLGLEEDFLLDNPEIFASMVHKLSELGVRLALESLAHERSILSFLLSVPEGTALKIGREFTKGIDSNPRQQAFMLNLVRLLRGLGIEAIVSGVETEGEREAMSAGGTASPCLLQGFNLSRPISGQELITLLGPPS